MNIVKKMSIFFAVFLVLASAVLPIAVNAASKVTTYDISDVLSDLETMKLSTGEAFNIDNYPDKNDQDLQPELIAVNEVGYSADPNKAQAYSIYFYVYNPRTVRSQYTETLVGTYNAATVSFEAAYNNEQKHYMYSNQNLLLVDASDDGRFFKFKYQCPADLYDLFNGKEKRVYRVESFNIMLGATVHSAYAAYIGQHQKYVFSGESVNKVVQYYDSPLIHLDLETTHYRTNTSSFGENYQNDIFTVYFAIPNSYLRDYEQFYGVRAAWNECQTDYIIVTDDELIYDDAKDYMIGRYSAVDHEYNGTAYDDYAMIFWDYDEYESDICTFYDAKYAWNLYDFDLQLDFFNVLNYLNYAPSYVHLVDDINDYYFNLSSVVYDSIKKFETGIKEYIVTNSDTLNIESLYKGDYWKQLFWGGHIFGVKELDRVVEPFYFLNSSEFSNYNISGDNSLLAENLLVQEKDLYNLKRYCEDAEAQDKTVVLFRHSLKPYYAAKAGYIFSDYADEHYYLNVRKNVEVCQTYYYTDVDIIDLRFQNADTVYIFPVDADPVSNYPGFDDNYDSNDSTKDFVNDAINKFKGAFNDRFAKLKTLLSVVLIAALILIFWKPISWILDKIINFFRRKKKNE